jgi:hypothetical protein
MVCPVNFANDALVQAVLAVEDEFLAGGAPDPSPVRAAAREMLDGTLAQIEFFEDEYFVWPDVVAEEFPAMHDYRVASLSTLNAIVNAPDYETAYYEPWPDATEAGDAAQKVRLALRIDADTYSTCEGHEDGTATLQAERDAREGDSE